MIFSFFRKKMGFWVFLVHPSVVLVLLSASVERCFVSRMRDFFLQSGEAYQWRVCYQRGPPRLVFIFLEVKPFGVVFTFIF